MNTETMRLLIAKGLSAEDILEISEAMDSKPARTANAERQARFRERRKGAKDNVISNVTRNGVTPPNDIYSNPPASSDEEAARAPKPDKFPCPEGVDPIDWDAVKANRKAKRAPLTEGAHRQIVRKLENWKRDGWPPGPIVAFAAERGWTSVFETDEMKGGNGGRTEATGSSFALQIIQQAEQRRATAES